MELWKSLRELTETVDASLPDPEGRHRVRHRHAGGIFRVYRQLHRDGRIYLGSASVPLGPEEFKPSPERWEEALEQAAEGRDPWYPLELPSSAPQVSRTSTLDKQDLARWVEPMEEILSQTLQGEPVLAVREHLRFAKTMVQYNDSFGKEREELRYQASLEVLMVPREAPDSQPFSAELRFSEFAPEVISGFLRDQARLTCDSFRVKPWEPQGDFLVLLRGATLAAVLGYLMEQLGAPALAAGTSGLSLHQPLWNHKGSPDPLTVTALAELYNSPKPGGFDDEGVVLKSHTLVSDGLVKGFWSTQATAHWLGLPLTGRPRNYSVSPGTQTWKALSGQRILEIHRLRWAQIDQATGTFSAEVGLADLHEGGTRTPVFGFTVEGNLRTILTNALFSSDVGTWEHYEGPEFLVVPSPFFRRL